MDLFAPVIPVGDAHPHFRFITSGEFEPELAVLRDWAREFVDRDNKFVKEFQSSFNSGLWELYLFSAFQQLGMRVELDHATPDFSLVGDTQSFCAEAVVASHPSKNAPEWSYSGNLEAIDELDMESILSVASLRLSSAITYKANKYLTTYRDLDHVNGKAFVVAVAPFEQPLFYLQGDRAIRRVLYSYDMPLVIQDPKGGAGKVVGVSRVGGEDKESGAFVDFGLFTNDTLRHVSAVLFSNTATWGKVRALSDRKDDLLLFRSVRFDPASGAPRVDVLPKPKYHETLLDGLHLFLNPFAEVPIDHAQFARAGVALHSYDPDTKAYYVAIPNGHLIQRSCVSLNPNLRTTVETIYPQSTAARARPAPWKEGELRYVGGHSGLFHDAHLAHFMGWTCLVVRDAIDGDWGAQALKGTYRTVGAFFISNAQDSLRTLACSEWYDSKDVAFESIRNMIIADRKSNAE